MNGLKTGTPNLIVTAPGMIAVYCVCNSFNLLILLYR